MGTANPLTLAGFDYRLLNFLPSAVYICDAPGGLIQFYNPRAAELWGRRPEYGETDRHFCQSLTFYIDGVPFRYDQTPMAEALRKGTPVRRREIVLERRDGCRMTVSLSIEPLVSESGEIIGTINLFEDVSPAAASEEAAHRTNRKRNDELLLRESRVLRQLAVGDPLESVLESVVHMVQHASNDELLPAVMLLDLDGIHLRCGPALSLPETYLKAIDGLAIGPAAGSPSVPIMMRQFSRS